MATHLQISGNPSKFLQGHNVFGSDDVVALMSDVFDIVCQRFELQPTEQELCDVRSGNYELTT